MLEIKDYSISEQVKTQLGIIIRETRIKRLNEFKKTNYIDGNPFTKVRFCENNQICHYHTLTKLESDFIKEDYVYHLFLNKLNLFFQIEGEDHRENINVLNDLAYQLLKVIEYGDYNLDIKIIDHLYELNFDRDCIASMYLELLIYSYRVFIKLEKDKKTTEKLVNYIGVYEGIFKAIALHTISYCYYQTHIIEEAKTYCLEAIELYKEHNISGGLSYLPLIRVYMKEFNYLEVLKICNELEEHYINTNNKMRLLQIYMLLSSYYLLINSHNFAKRYYDESIYLADNDKKLKHLLHSLHFNWGLKKIYTYEYEQSLSFFNLALNCCFESDKMLKIINRLLLVYTKIGSNKKIYIELIEKGKDYYQFSVEIEQNIFRYYNYKLNNPNYSRRFALKKVIPKLQTMKAMKIVLLSFYEDLYD